VLHRRLRHKIQSSVANILPADALVEAGPLGVATALGRNAA
jgi:hypothetical protein